MTPNEMIKRIQDAVAAKAGFTALDLIGSERTQYVVWTRHVAMWACVMLLRGQVKPELFGRSFTTISLPQIGGAFHRHHGAVLHAFRLVNDYRSQKPSVSVELDRLLDSISEELNATNIVQLKSNAA